MLKIGITQRVDYIESIDETRDVLDQRWTKLLAENDFITVPIPNTCNVSNFRKEGDILFITGAYSSVFDNRIVLYQPKIGHGTVTKIGEFFLIFSLKPNISDQKIFPQNNNNN